jgi:hypothetical protein
MHKIYLCQSFMHSWEPTECLGIQILTIKLLLVISILVFVFFGTPQGVSKKRRPLEIKYIVKI